MLIILFGLSGSGKNFVGEILAKEFHFHYWDADAALPEKMREAIAHKQFFTQAMRDEMTELVIKKIDALQSQHEHLVISQALYKEKNRTTLSIAFPGAIFVHVKTTLENIRTRLNKRKNGISYDYAYQISQFFEEPLLAHKILINESDQNAIIGQIKPWLVE
ncbi:MAG: hypothetical protein ACD_44C00148G0001 [uncultured bacterium]|nr:MAG: hypothetical protein ACD_44C00148G0001 [uncultured bacterium]